MKLLLLADIHCQQDHLNNLPSADVMIVAGDFCSYGNSKEAARFLQWYEKQPSPFKLLIAGNHDRCFEYPEKRASLLSKAPSIIYLQDQEIVIDGVKFYGSPWQPEFYNWAFNLPRGEPLRKKWAAIPDDCDVLITHGPPAGIADKNLDGINCGCEDLLDRVIQVKPQVQVFGHIHLGYGMNYQSIPPTTFINCSICTEDYRPDNPPVEFEIFK